MKKIIDSISIRCIAHATEDFEKVKAAMEFISGRRDFRVINTKGYHGNEIRILELEIKKSSEITAFWKRLLHLGLYDEIIARIDELVDESGMFYLRFDKQEAYLGRLAIATSGDTIAMRMKILSYPRNRKMAIKNFLEFIRKIQSSQR